MYRARTQSRALLIARNVPFFYFKLTLRRKAKKLPDTGLFTFFQSPLKRRIYKTSMTLKVVRAGVSTSSHSEQSR